MNIHTIRQAFSKLLAANSTDAAFAAVAPTTTKPTAGVIDLTTGLVIANQLVLAVFGAGAENAAGQVRLVHWRNVGALWVPTPLIVLDVTLGTAVGAAGQDVINTDRFADTIAANGTPPLPSDMYRILSPADNTVGLVIADVFGAGLVQVQFLKGTATNLNCLYSWI